MLDFTNRDAEICVIGRTSFTSGMGAVTYSFCEMLSRSFPICILPTEEKQRKKKLIALPSGRTIPVCVKKSVLKVSIFCDVLWNGHWDRNLDLVPRHTLKYGYAIFDSDELPRPWVSALNDLFDVAIVSSPHLVSVARASGVKTPIACLPLALDIEHLLTLSYKPPSTEKIRFLSVSAFHPRKDIPTLVEAFAERFRHRTDAELLLHSNLNFKGTYEAVQQQIRDQGLTNVHATCSPYSHDKKNGLIQSSDVFLSASRGEGYSIGPREALALGKPAVLSDVGGHKSLSDCPGVFMVPADIAVPARYPEIENLVYGEQRKVRVSEMADALERAATYARSEACLREAPERRRFARNFAFSKLTSSYAELLNTDIGLFRAPRSPVPGVNFPSEFRDRVNNALGQRATRLKSKRQIVVPAHDGGFFSVFNSFMSHLVWDLQEDRCHAVLPDWNVERMMERHKVSKFVSFCYGKPGEGNVWAKLFRPLFGLSDAEMDDPEILYAHSSLPKSLYNQHREPQLTYMHAYELYKTKRFALWRQHYHRIFSQHVHLQPSLQEEIDCFARSALTRPFMIAAHVRHPSHSMEQPGRAMASNKAYLDRVRELLHERNVHESSDEWGLFLATDQQRVVKEFQAEFGDHVAFFDDVRRTGSREDGQYQSESDKLKAGHQVQHLAAADPASWSSRLAWEVIRDAYAMARCDALLHVVSNVSTAVSYINPRVEMIFCPPAKV